MKPKAKFICTALLGFGVVAFIAQFLITPADPRYGVFSRFSATTTGILSVLCASIWVGVANFNTKSGKTLLIILICTILGYSVFSFYLEGFGHKILATILLGIGLSLSLPLNLFLLYRAWVKDRKQ
jgi:hypothetical protein